MDPSEVLYKEHQALHKLNIESIKNCYSGIQHFYQGTSVFLTGGTGFLGKQLIEKLIRSCKIERIYMLIRSKKGMPVKERLANYLKEPVYDELKKNQPDFADKITLIEGDIGEIRLGIDEKDWTKLTQEVNIILHVAATTRFDEHLQTSTFINIRGTREVLTLAKECQNLKAVVHVSTVFSHATESKIKKEVLEQFYPSPIPPDTMILMAETVNGDRLNAITPELIKDWPNTYTFTKAIAEEVVRIMGDGLPICIVRPPVVYPSYHEPVPGWIDSSNMYGPTGIIKKNPKVILGIGIGAMHVTLNGDDVETPTVPVDFVNNAIIASAYDTAGRVGDDIKIYTIRNGTRFTCGMFGRTLRSPEIKKLCTPKAIWYCYGLDTDSKLIYWLLTWFMHYIPAYMIDTICFALHIKMPKEIPSVVKMYEKMYKTTLAYSYFILNEWNFQNDNTRKMYEDLSEADKVLFNFDTKNLDLTKLLTVWCLGLKVFVVKDGLKDTAYALKKQKWLRIANYIFYGVYLFIIWFLLSVIVKFFINLF